MKDRKTVSLCMIVKDEEWILDRCLSSVRDIVDEIIIGDTGSKDRSKEIAERYGAYVFDIKWEDDFARARNLTLNKATCDWILLLDADEIFNTEDRDTFFSLLESEDYDGYHFTLINYFTEDNLKDYSVHYAFRLLRNTGEYYFDGRIHEQINHISGSLDASRFTLADVTLFHYGYTDRVIHQKEKHKRNMPLLEKQLAEKPTDPYFLFNIGNEYMALGDYEKALDSYLKSYEQKAVTQAYFPHIYYRIILCYITLKDYEKALFYAGEGLEIYPACTDIEYLRGTIYKARRRHLPAIASFKQCLSMGEAPNSLKFSGGCGTFKACLSMGDIYYEEELYTEALESYVNASAYPEAPDCSLSIGKALSPLCKDSTEFYDRLSSYLPFSDSEEKLLHGVDVLIEMKHYETALTIINQSHFFTKWEDDLLFLKGKLFFHLQLYDSAFRSLIRLYDRNTSLSVLAASQEIVLSYLFVSLILWEPRKIITYTSLSGILQGRYGSTALFLVNRLFPDILKDGDSSKLEYSFFFQMLELLLKAGSMDLFHKLLPSVYSLFLLDSYLKLSEIYIRQGYKKEAAEAVLGSIRNYNYIDKESAWRLCDCL